MSWSLIFNVKAKTKCIILHKVLGIFVIVTINQLIMLRIGQWYDMHCIYSGGDNMLQKNHTKYRSTRYMSDRTLRYACFFALPNQELSVLYGGPTLNYGEQLSLYVPYMLRVSMTGDLAHLQLSDLQGETRPIYRTSDLQGERMLICRTWWPYSLLK